MIAALPLSVSAAGEYVPGNPRWSGYQNQVQWGRPAGAASGDSFEYEAQLLLGDDVVESKAVEIDTYLFFTNDVVTRPQEEYTIRVRARWIMIVGDPDGQYMVADVGEAEPPHEHSYTQKHDAAQHWQECSCGERLNVANHIYGDWRETKPATETEAGSRERDCTVCDYVQTETIPMLEHEHSYGDWQKDETQHWKECRCGEKTEVGNHTFGDWTITKEPTTTETGSRERTCSICKYTQEETIPVHEHSIHDEAWKYDDTKVNLLVDIQAKLQAGKGAGYVRWAKVFNLKQMAQTVNFLTEHNLLEYAVLEEKSAAATAHHNELSAKIKEAEKRMAEIAVLRTHIINYAKTRDTYVAYRKAGYSKKFRQEHEEEILLHQAAKNAFDDMGVKKLPKVKELQAEYARLLEEKKKTYAEYRRSREEMRELLAVKANVDRLLNMVTEHDTENEKDHDQR